MRYLLFLFLFLFLLLPGILLGQLPDAYSSSQLAAIEERIRILKQQYDVVLDPIEQTPTAPSAYQLAEGNWANAWTGATDWGERITSAAKREVIIYVLDTAPSLDHPFLSDVAWNSAGRSFTGEETIVDGDGHGHHVAGCIGAIGDIPLGVGESLVNAGKLRIVPVEVLNDGGAGLYSWIQAGVEYSVSHFKSRPGSFGIITMSLGGGGSSPALDAALGNAKAAGMLLFAAAGNTGNDGIQYPGNSEHTLPIGSIDASGRKSRFSTTGDGLFMGSPGRDIVSTFIDGQLARLSGTSMATPIQAAIAAVVASVHSSLDAEGVEAMMVQYARDIDPTGYDTGTGHGYNHFRELMEVDTPDPDPYPVRGEKAKHSVKILLPGPYTIQYQSGEGLFRPITLTDLELRVKTREYSENLGAIVEPLVREFFVDRAMSLTDKADALVAGHWAGRFMEIGITEINLIFDSATITDEFGFKGFPDKPPFWNIFGPSKRRTFTF